MIRFIVVWQAYGEWKATSYLFSTEAEAQKHINKVLLRKDALNPEQLEKDYNKNAQIIPIEIDPNGGANP